MVQIDVPIAFAAGCMFADAASQQLRSGQGAYFSETLLKSNIFQIFFFSWIPVYFILNFFGWETTFMWWKDDSVISYAFFLPVFMVVFFLAANAGFLLGNWLVTRGLLLANRIVYGIIVVYSAVWIFAQTGRTLRVGTRSQWEKGTAQWFYEDTTFLVMLIVSLGIFGIALALFLLQLHRQGKRMAA